MRWRATIICVRAGGNISACRLAPMIYNQPTGIDGTGQRGFPHSITTLVTGATGFLGSHVARQLVTAGHSVRVLVRSTSNPQALEGLNAERAVGELQDMVSLDRAMKGVRRVFHVAADYRLWTRNPNEIYATNVEGTRRLLEVAGRA